MSSSRRDFLKKATMAGAGLAIAPQITNAITKKEEKKK